MKHETFPSDGPTYFAHSATWSEDILGGLRASRRRAYIVAGIAALVALLEAGALMALAPLKTVVPYTITVDRQTGYVETAEPLKPGALAQDEAVVKAFLAQYVLARESFDVTDLQAEYAKVAAWTTGPAREQYIAAMQRSNPHSPINLYDARTVMKVTIKSISLLGRGSALIRFDAQRLVDGHPMPERHSYAAVIAFRFTGQPMRNEDRFQNPLGFQITQYRRDAEFAEPASVGAGAP